MPEIMTPHSVTFRWTETDPKRPAQDVLVRMIAITDHAYDDGDLSPYLLERVSDGHWQRTIPLPADLRTSYQLCPVRDFSLRDTHPTEQQWMAALAAGMPDPGADSAVPPGNTWGNDRPASILELPDALPQPWTGPRQNEPGGRLERVQLDTSVVNYWQPPGRRLTEELPVVISFDGSAFRRMGIETTFANLVADEAVPPFRAVLVESIHGSAERGPTRLRSLTHPTEFVGFVVDELLPWLGHPEVVVVAGQSLGGLAAAHLAAVAPDRISAVIGQSPALWWPGDDEGGLSGGGVIDAYESGQPGAVRFFLEAGTEEREVLLSSRRFHEVLHRCGYDVRFREYRGGHDYACWRGGIADGIVATLGVADRMADRRNTRSGGS